MRRLRMLFHLTPLYVLTGSVAVSPAAAQPPACPVTIANMEQPPGDRWAHPHGTGALWIELWSKGRAAVKPERDGSLRLKLPWFRAVTGPLEITGRRLDGDGVLQAIVPREYGLRGFQSSRVIFSAPGCWEITGRVGDDRLTVVIEVYLKS